MKKQQTECPHRGVESHKHRRKNYPFGKKSKARFYGIKKVTVHCLKCKKIIDGWKVN